MKKTHSLVIPCYNEENNIDLLIKKSQDILINKNIELILVDNGSTDKTRDKIISQQKSYTNLILVVVDDNRGIGFGIHKGLMAANGDIIGYTHADLQTDPNDFLKGIDWINKNLNRNDDFFLKGLRQSRSKISNLFTIFMGIYETLLFGVKMHDIGAQPVIFKKKMLENLKLFPNNFTMEIYLYYFAITHNYIVHRFDVVFLDRKFDKGNNDYLYQKFSNSIIVAFESIILRIKIFFI